MSQTLEDLKAARSWLAEHEWIQRESFVENPDGQYIAACAAGATEIVAGWPDDGYYIRSDAMIAALDVNDLVEFNDAVDRTKGEVLALFDEAIARLEASDE